MSGQQQNAPGQKRTVAQVVDDLRALNNARRFEESRVLAAAALAQFPKHPDLLHQGATAELLAGRPDLALPLFDRALALEPNNVQHMRGLAATLKTMGRLSEALDVTERALQMATSVKSSLNPQQINRQVDTHHLQCRPVNHVLYRKSKIASETVQRWLDHGHEPDDLARVYFLMDNMARTLARGVPGAIAELGVWRGYTAKVLKSASPGRMLYLFDTFAGFVPEEVEGDRRAHLFRDTSLEAVQAYVGLDQVVYCPGAFPDSAQDIPDDLRFAFVHLDCDLEQPMRAGLEFFYPRMNPGGLIVVHDYGNDAWPGVAVAVDGFLADKPEKPVMIPDKSSSAAIIKA